MPKPKAYAGRLAALGFGLKAERIAALWLMLKGYRILARRYIVSSGEIDIVAQRGDVIAFVEVKGRRALEDALTAITVRKRQRLHRAIRRWVASNPWATEKVLRGDALFVAPRRLPRHLADAFPVEI